MSKIRRAGILPGFLLILIPIFTSASTWIRHFGGEAADRGNWVEVTADSGFIICGYMTLKSGGSIDAAQVGYLARTDSLGNAMWTRAYSYPTDLPNVSFHCVQQTADSGYVMTGRTNEGLSIRNLLLMKVNSAGIIQWSHLYGGDQKDQGWFVRQTPDSGYIVCGSTRSFGPGYQYQGLWLLRTDSLGDTLWTRIYGAEAEDVKDFGYCVNLTSDGNYIVTGGNGTKRALWLLKIDDDGDTLWTKTYASGGDTWGRYVEETADGGFIVTGASVAGEALYLVKTDEDGDSVWAKSYGYGEGYTNEGRCVKQTADGGYIIGARRDYDDGICKAGLMKTDSQGDTLWTRNFSNPDFDLYNDSRCVQLTPDGGYVMTGTGNIEGPGLDIWLIKTDSLGYVSVAEDKAQPTQVQVTSTVDTHITLYYTEHPNGFHAYVYDASGRKVGEIHNASASGTVEWGQNQQAGVYFIRQLSGSPSVHKVVLVK